jgi:hypothetical protein
MFLSAVDRSVGAVTGTDELLGRRWVWRRLDPARP